MSEQIELSEDDAVPCAPGCVAVGDHSSTGCEVPSACDHESQFFDDRWRCLRCGETLPPFASPRGYCQQEHAAGGVTYWCELRAGHPGPHRSTDYEWARR